MIILFNYIIIVQPLSKRGRQRRDACLRPAKVGEQWVIKTKSRFISGCRSFRFDTVSIIYLKVIVNTNMIIRFK